MTTKRHKPEEIVTKLRQVDVLVFACSNSSIIPDRSFYHALFLVFAMVACPQAKDLDVVWRKAIETMRLLQHLKKEMQFWVLQKVNFDGLHQGLHNRQFIPNSPLN